MGEGWGEGSAVVDAVDSSIVGSAWRKPLGEISDQLLFLVQRPAQGFPNAGM